MDILEEYQEVFISDIKTSLIEHQAIIAQLATGGGKTVCFATICKRFIDFSGKDIIIFVHRKELLEQTRKTLWKWYGIVSQEISANTKVIDSNAKVFVSMVETFNNRAKNSKFLDYMSNVGLCIVDEAHLSNFKKIFIHFLNALRLGFTATPISATKKDPLVNYYSSIVVGPSIKDLIAFNKKHQNRGVVQDISYAIKNINRSELEKKGDDFDADKMGLKFSSPRQIQNTIDAYIKWSNGKKALCFNANVAHSVLVTEAMCKEGLNARHLDGTCDDSYREDCFRWLKNTPNAILCNVGIATTGFDEPSIEVVIINKSTLSYTLWLQMCGRGARPYKYPDGILKDHFSVIDMGDNIIGGAMGEWSDDMDWENAFFNPKKPREGVAPKKLCPLCNGLCAASARVCRNMVYNWLQPDEGMEECGYNFPIKAAKEDTLAKECILITSNVDVKYNIELFINRAEYFSLFETIRQVAFHARGTIEGDSLDEAQLEAIWDLCYMKIREWYKLKGKRNNGWMKKDGRFKLVNELKDLGFNINIEESIKEEEEIYDINTENQWDIFQEG